VNGRPSTGQLNDLDQACHNVSEDMARRRQFHKSFRGGCSTGAIIKGVILETTKQKTEDGESLLGPLASYPVIWEILERSDETIRGCVPHLIVSSDTESRVADDRQRRYEGDAKN
jgi:hypothetical protein